MTFSNLLTTRGRPLLAGLGVLLWLAAGSSHASSVEDDETHHRAQCVQVFEWLALEQVRFGQSTSWIRRSSYPFLQRLAEMAHTCPSFAISITGHTDNVGDPAFNQHLSLQRAEAVARFLQSLGVAPERLLVAGKGAAEPLADNNTAFGREQNRRIEFRLVPVDDS